MSNYNLFQEEENLLLENILKTYRYDILKSSRVDNDGFKKIIQIEFVITSTCNLKCEYCYLQKFADELVPPSCRDEKTIIRNLKLFLNFWKEQNFKCNLDLFSGEIWHTDFGIEILNIILDYVKDGLTIYNITIPSNSSFIFSDKYDIIRNLIYEFRKIGTNLVFSASVDGMILEDTTRPFKDPNYKNIRTEEYYIKLFEFCKEFGFGFHPMLAAYGIEKWIDNWNWWVDFFLKHYKNDYLAAYNKIMILEVRNNDWTEEKLQYFKKFQDYYYNWVWEKVANKNPEIMTKIITKTEEEKYGQNYSILQTMESDNVINCSIGRALIIRLGDLAILPCHRTAYDKYIYGHYIIEDDKITGKVKAKNTLMPIICNIGNINNMFSKCHSCDIQSVCFKGCIGSQIENMREPTLCIPCICELEHLRIINNCRNMAKTGVLKFIQNELKQRESILSKISIEEEELPVRRTLVQYYTNLENLVALSQAYGVIYE